MSAAGQTPEKNPEDAGDGHGTLDQRPDFEDELREERVKKPERVRQGYTRLEAQYTKPNRTHREVYILGMGSVGRLVAHSLRSMPDPPVVRLLFHKRKELEQFVGGPKQITIRRNGIDYRSAGHEAYLLPQVDRVHGVSQEPWKALPANQWKRFEDTEGQEEAPEEESQDDVDRLLNDYEMMAAKQESEAPSTYTPMQHETSDMPPEEEMTDQRLLPYVMHTEIRNLIVTTKTPVTVGAILPLVHRITPETTICLLQNGMGVIEELNSKIWKDPRTRPTYVQGIISHGVNIPREMKNTFAAIHAGQGSIALGIRPPLGERSVEGTAAHEDPLADQRPASARYLMRLLTSSPDLLAVTYPPTELLKLQLEKLAVNAIINPLTALLDVPNGQLFRTFYSVRTMRLMLAEISLVIRSLPELQGLANVPSRFSSEQLEKLVRKVARGTSENISSMLADVRAERMTEIRHINGYIIKRGEKLGIKCVVNYGIMNMVQAKVQLAHQTSAMEKTALKTTQTAQEG